jgi:hypothetical protein
MVRPGRRAIRANSLAIRRTAGRRRAWRLAPLLISSREARHPAAAAAPESIVSTKTWFARPSAVLLIALSVSPFTAPFSIDGLTADRTPWDVHDSAQPNKALVLRI